MSAHHDRHHDHVDYAQHNKEYFDTIGAKYDSHELAQTLTPKIGNAFKNLYDFDEEKTVVMDFACGTGLISRELIANVKKIVGVDISQGMVDHYNTRVANQGIPPEEMHAVCTTLKGEEGELDGQKFDVIVCSSAYHHFPDIQAITTTLTSFLKPAGVLLISDLVSETADDFFAAVDDHFVPTEQKADVLKHVVAHKHGFDECEIRETFQKAGLVNVEWKPTVRVTRNEKEVKIFVAKGVKPAEGA